MNSSKIFVLFFFFGNLTFKEEILILQYKFKVSSELLKEPHNSLVLFNDNYIPVFYYTTIYNDIFVGKRSKIGVCKAKRPVHELFKYPNVKF